MNRPQVYKVGGSLLGWASLPQRLTALLQNENLAAPRVLIAGGSGAADWIRVLDQKHQLGQERSHFLALHALDLSAAVLRDLITETTLTTDIEELPGLWSQGRTPILAPRAFVLGEDNTEAPLPHHWDLTSDSIAARLADRLGGDLVLLKSAPLPPGTSRAEAARAGLVDPLFPVIAAQLGNVYWLDLRGDQEPHLLLMPP